MTAVAGHSEKDARRFVHKVEVREDHACWKWLGALRPYGTPVFWFDGQARSAQDFSYMLAYGSLAEGHAAHPVCETPDCVNPRHLVAEWSPRRWQWPEELHDAG
jgi:hypothetical protein